MIGFGKTKEESLLNSGENFSKWAKKRNNSLQRPGKKVPIKFAENKLINKYPELLDDFLSRIIEINKEKILYVSDITSIYDFYPEGEKGEYNGKIKKVYSVDVSDIKDGNIAKILNRIAKKQNADI